MFSHVLPKGSYRRIIAGNTISQLIGRVVSSVSVFLMSFIIAQRFGPEGYGDFVKITTYVGFFYLLADFGINAVYLQKANSAQSPQGRDPVWQELFGLRILLSMVLLAAAFLLLDAFPVGFGQGYTPLVRTGIRLLIPVILFQAVTTTTNALFQRLLRYDRATVAQTVGSMVMVLVTIGLVFFVPALGPLLGVVSVFSGGVATSLVALLFVARTISDARPVFRRAALVRLFSEAAPLGLALVFNLIYFHADSVILTIYRSTKEVGIYGLAYKVFELPLVVPIFFMNAVYPMLLMSMKGPRRGDIPSTRAVLRTAFFVLLVSSILIAAALWVASPLLTLIRADFAESILPLRILLLGLPIFFVSALYMWFIIAARKQTILLLIHGVAMVGNIAANILVVPTKGYVASAWITVASEAFVLAMSALYVYTGKRHDAKGGT